MEFNITEIANYFSPLKIVEIVGLFTGIAYVIGAILEKKWCWYFGIIAVIAYGISTYFFQLYGEFALQFMYLALSFYGLSQWKSNNDSKKEFLKVEKSSTTYLIKAIIFGSLFSFVIYWLLIYFKGTYPFWDSLTSGFGIVATYMTAKKKIENWYLWVVIDTILAPVLYLKGMPFYAVLYIVYIGFAILGYFQWKKEMKS